MLRRRSVDRVVAGAVGAAGIASILTAVWIGYRSWAALGDAVRRMVTGPLSFQAPEALVTGIVAADLMVLQVVLLARLPWLERAWGRTRLLWLHRWLGFWSFWLMLVHVVLFVVQRTSRRPGAVGGALLDLFVREQHMLLATVGTALLVLVTVTSVARARRRLRYETWHLVHLWSYVGIGLVLPHELVSSDFLAPGVRAYWWCLHLGALALVLVFRVGRPLLVSVRHRLRVAEVVVEPGARGDVVSVVVTGRRLDRLPARAGDFLVWRFGGPGRTRGHPYSLSRAPDGVSLRITAGGPGDGARTLAGLAPGARVLVEGPYGDLADRPRRRPHLLVLAAGVGVTPFRALLESLPLTPGEATIVLRASSEADLVLAAEIDDLAGRRGIRVVRLVGPRRAAWSFLPAGVEGPAHEVLADLAPDLLASDVLVCGPGPWAWGARRAALDAGVARRDVHVERFAG